MSRDPRIDPRAGDIVRDSNDGTPFDFVVLAVRATIKSGGIAWMVHWCAAKDELDDGTLHVDAMTLTEWREGFAYATVIRTAGEAA